MAELRTEPGTLIAAAPDMLDPNFMHSVVLMCQHNEHGAYGLTVNRPASITVNVLMPDHPVLAKQAFQVFAGGPVGLDTLQFVHRIPERIPDGLELGSGLYLGGDLEALAQCIADQGKAAESQVRLIIGYSGWGEGQLEAELATGCWLPAPLDLESLFEPDPQVSWRRVLRSLGRDTAGLVDLPPDVSWN